MLLVLLSTTYIVQVPNAQALNEVRTKTVYITKDTYLYEAYPDNNYGSASFLSVGISGLNGKRIRSLIYFSLSGITSSYEIVSAKLVLTLSGKGDFASSYKNFWVFRLTQYWVESAATWNKRTSTSSWSAAGGTAAHDGPLSYGSYGYFQVKTSDPVGKVFEIDVTQLVRKYVSGGASNYGIIIMGDTQTGWVHFYSSEVSDASKRPRLVIKYRVPKIKLTSNTYSASLKQGETAEFTVTADYQLINTGTLTLTVYQDLPSGKGFSRTFYQVSKTSSKWVVKVKVTASPTTPRGVYYLKFYVRGKASTSGANVQSNSVTLRIAVTESGTFNVVLNPSTLSMHAGEERSISVNVLGQGGFNSPVALSVTSKPPGFNVALNASSVNPGSAASLTVSVGGSVQPGTYHVVLSASGAGKTVTKDLTVVVTAPPFDFDLSATPARLEVKAGAQATFTVKAVLKSGGAEQLSLALTGLPAGTSYAFTPATLTPTGSATLTVDTTGLEGDYTLVVTASGGGVSRQATLQLHVTPAEPVKNETSGAVDFSITLSPSTVEMNQGETATVVVTVTGKGGAAKPVALTLVGLPGGASYTFNPSSVTPTGSSVLTINSGSAKGTFTLLVKGNAEGVERTATLTLKVNEKKCIIATVTYGSEVSREVNFLRGFRDNIVLSTLAGRMFYVFFDSFYYSWSPGVAQFILVHPVLKAPLRALLYPLIGSLVAASYVSSPLMGVSPEAGVYVAGAVASLLLGLAYLAPLIYLAERLFRRRVVRRHVEAAFLASLALLALSLMFEAVAPVALVALTPLFVAATMVAAGLGAVWAVRGAYMWVRSRRVK